MRWLKRLLYAMAISGLVLVAIALGVRWYLNVDYQRTEVIYGRKYGTALTMDVFQPSRTNGRGIVVLISGSWKSSHESINPLLFVPFLRRGYTMFAVVHGAQPRFTVAEIVEDLHRSVRFVRYEARRFGVDRDRLGVIGGSSGGHLCLMLATRGAPGLADSRDPVDRESSAVQAVACFYPVTDLLNLGSSTENLGDGGPPKSFRRAFGAEAATNLPAWKVVGRELSPIFHVTSNVPPTLIIHGGADTLVPLDQSERYVKAVRAAGGEIRLMVRPGKKHGWLTMVLDLFPMADWFDVHLARD